MPKLSIIIPTHNRPDRLKKAVESSVKQSYEDLEIIVVDDGSCPAANYEKMGSQVFGFRHEYARGVSAARNTGLAQATGEYIAFLDDDDVLHPGYAAAMIEFFDSNKGEIDFAWSSLSVHDESSGKSTVARQRPCMIRRQSRSSELDYEAVAYVGASGMCFRAEVLRQFEGFDESLTVSEDRELAFRMLSGGSGCGAITTPLVDCFVHAGPRLSTNENLLKQAQSDALVADRHSDFIDRHPKLASRYLNLLARRQKDAGLIKDYRRTLVRILRVNRLDVRAFKRLLLSMLRL
ncbi:glycosyltransferase family 2 protein [Marinobacter sp. AL4B]|uniref:glycosyltransferase family 2 protein n=1 Tax=Marinobacter sp. AL4B TaxID=2871173 RepID=UPI001CAA4705|nr:glycosyltransferase family 2 protein [Marinobacter sp. AL4B]MBZ0332624.1 glycosyltransferase [Marinobacter sp. AL4B]